MTPLRYGSETLHIALASLSQTKPKEQLRQLVKSLYEQYKRDIDVYSDGSDSSEEYSHLYQPLIYYIFGNYDVALISVVNNYKFAQRQVTLGLGDDGPTDLDDPNFFQVITGALPLIKDEINLKDLFKAPAPDRKSLIGISNLKLNNKLLIGNGSFFLDPVMRLIDQTLEGLFKGEAAPRSEHFIQQSYSWFEITVIVFSERIATLSAVIGAIRRLTLKDLLPLLTGSSREQLLADSLYESALADPEHRDHLTPHLFANTHSYFGVEQTKLGSPSRELANQPIDAQVEWEVKPGHFAELYKTLRELNTEAGPIFDDPGYLLPGKMDHLLPIKTAVFASNLKLEAELQTNERIAGLVRKVKTKILLPLINPPTGNEANDEYHPDFRRWAREHCLPASPSPREVNDRLKALKLSRNLRNKINKIYYNYRIGVQDPILFTYFLDFKIFMKNLTKQLEQENDEFQDAFDSPVDPAKMKKPSVNELEASLAKTIEIFEEGYNIRMLNAHHYEDINDFDLDFNSSIQQILSTYNTVAAHISNLFFELDSQGPVVQLNLMNTESNYDSINYDVYHLTSPEFVLFTLTKEVLNKYILANEEEVKKENRHRRQDDQLPSIRSIIEELEKEAVECTLRDLFQSNLIKFEYYYLDSVQFIQTCNLDADLYEYWFWTYIFQNAALYDKSGTMNEDHFRKELTRLYFVFTLFGVDIKKLQCPLPEIWSLWERHSPSIAEGVLQFFTNSRHIGRFKLAVLTIFKYPTSPKTLDVTDEKERMIYESSFERLTAWLKDQKGKFFSDQEKGAEKDPVLLRRMIFVLRDQAAIRGCIEQGVPYCGTKEQVSEFHYLNTFMYAYLKLIYDRNRQVRIVRRDCKTGKPLRVFIRDPCEPCLYSVDPFGGIFFSSNGKSAEYFKIRNAALQSLWHCSLLFKKELYFKPSP